jgi:hypothetical protein
MPHLRSGYLIITPNTALERIGYLTPHLRSYSKVACVLIYYIHTTNNQQQWVSNAALEKWVSNNA